MAEHLEYYTTFKDGVRQNNGAVYEATKPNSKPSRETGKKVKNQTSLGEQHVPRVHVKVCV